MTLAEQMAADAAESEAAKPKTLAESMAADSVDGGKPAINASALGTDAQNFAAGAGKAVTDLGRGAKQIIDAPAQWLESKFPGLSAWSQSMGMPSAKASAAKTNADINESRVLDAPLMSTNAGVAGNIGGNIASMMVPLSALSRVGFPGAAALLNPSTYTAAAASGAANGALQPVADGESRATNTAVGAGAGMLGNAIVNTVGRVAQPIANQLTAAHARAVQLLQNAGVPLDAAQLTGSAFLNRLKSSFSDNPFTTGAQAEANHAQQSAFNRAVLGTVGEQGATNATPEVMARASDRINGVFHDVLNRNNVAVSDPMVRRIAGIQQAANDEEKGAVSNIANRFMGLVREDGTIPGQQVYNVKKDLDRLASSSDTTLAYHARQLRTTIMDAINESLPTEDRAAFQQARLQFGNLKKIEPTIDKLGNGNISPARLASVVSQKANRGATIYGRGNTELSDLAQAGNMLLGDKLPNSGTAARAAMQIALPLTAGIAGGASDARNGDYGSAAKNAAIAATTMALAPRAAQYVINNPATANYLSQGMTGSLQPLRNVLLLPQNNAMVGGALRRLPGVIPQSVPAQ